MTGFVSVDVATFAHDPLHFVVDGSELLGCPVKYRAKRTARNAIARSLKGFFTTAKWHTVVATTHRNVRMKTWAIVSAVHYARWGCSRDDVMSIFGSQRLQDKLLDDEVLSHMLDAFNDLAIANLTKVRERVAVGEVIRLHLACLDDRWNCLSSSTPIVPFGLPSSSCLATFLLGTSLGLGRHGSTLNSQFIGVNLPPYLIAHRRNLFRSLAEKPSLETRDLLGQIRELFGSLGELRSKLCILLSQIRHNVTSRRV